MPVRCIRRTLHCQAGQITMRSLQAVASDGHGNKFPATHPVIRDLRLLCTHALVEHLFEGFLQFRRLLWRQLWFSGICASRPALLSCPASLT